MKQDGEQPIATGEVTSPGVEMLDSQPNRGGSQAAPGRPDEGEALASGMHDAMLLAAPDCIITIDHEGRILEFNPAAEETFGYARAEALGRPMVDLIMPPSWRQRHRRGIAHYLATGKSRILGRCVEVTAMRADGSEFPAELTVSRVPVEGAPLFTAYLRDITERKRTETELQERAQQFRGLFEQAAVGIAQVGLDGQLLRANQRLCDFLGYSMEELLARRVEDVTYPDDLDTDLGELRRLLDGEIATYLLENRYVRKDGALVWGNLAVSLVRSAEGEPLYVIAVVEDITARKLLEERLRQAEAKARAQARRLDAVIEAVPDAVSIHDATGRIIRLNAAGQRSVGPLRGHEALPELSRVYDLRTPGGEPYPLDQQPVARALRGETVEEAEILVGDMPSATGVERQPLHVLVSAAPFYDERGQVEGVVTVTHDVTAVRRAEREATARARQFEALFDAITDSIFVYDADGRIVQANAAVRKLFAFESLPDYASRPLRERVPLVDTRDERGQPLPMDQWPQRRVLRGEVLAGESARDYRLRVLDGREVVVNVSGAPIRDTQDAVVGAVLILRDVTERRRLEQRTQEALNALLAMAETLVSAPEHDQLEPEQVPPEAQVHAGTYAVARELAELTRRVLGCERVSLTTQDPSTEQARPLAVVGLPPELERVWWDSVPELRQGGYMDEASASRLLAGEPVVLEFAQRLNPDLPAYGAEKTLVVPMLLRGEMVGTLTAGYGGTPHVYSASEIALAAAVAQLSSLVVERERLLREREAARASVIALQDTNRRMDEFVGIAAHELKTPVTTIKTNVQVILRRLQEAGQPAAKPQDLARLVEMSQTFLRRAERGSERLARLVDDMLDVSRIQAGKLELHLEPCDLATVVRETVDEQRQLNPRRSIDLNLPPGGPVAVMADVDRIGQVVTNYVTNALKYSRDFQPVAVDLRLEGATARVCVRDAGRGLPEEEHERIWHLFHRAPGIEVQTGSGVGLGLGLHISKTIVERHGGQVGVESAPGAGSTFWFTLPLARG